MQGITQTAERSDITQLESNPSALSDYFRHYMTFPLRVRGRVALHLALGFLRRKQRIWVSALRSFRGHIYLLAAKEEALGNPGPLFQYDAEGNLRQSTRTLARTLYIEKWLSVCPWADQADVETFLMGFDAGEQWQPGKSDSCIESSRTRDQRSTWLVPQDGVEIWNAVKKETQN